MELWQGFPEKFTPSPVFKRPCGSCVFEGSRGAGRIRWTAVHPCRFLLSEASAIFGYARVSLALCRSLLPVQERLWKLSLASLWRLLEAGSLRLCESLFGLLVSIESAPVAYTCHESSRWILHAVYLIYANWGLDFLCYGSQERNFSWLGQGLLFDSIWMVVDSDLRARSRLIIPDNTSRPRSWPVVSTLETDGFQIFYKFIILIVCNTVLNILQSKIGSTSIPK